MKHYIGIDLGTTNSAICSFDGEKTRIWKSPEQSDVTPSAIFIDRRGNRFYGTRAYNQAPAAPDNSATLFKRYMGTNTKIKLRALQLEMTPEECSAEILKVLYGYLPEEIRNDPDTATVITVPAAFNQMRKNATLDAAKMAGIGKVALMQEPVAAIMSVMQTQKNEGIFLIYDLGGGTFDVSIAENIGGKVNLLGHGGIEVCGGRDIDRLIFNNIVYPWIADNFDIPDDFASNKKYARFRRIAIWAAEAAKIELSSNETACISLNEMQAGTTDESGMEMYLDIDITRPMIDRLLNDIINSTIEKTRETMETAGITANDVEMIVFVGGPTNYKPLRDRVAFELALKANIDVNPMTAVAEGASIFAESIDWSSESHNRKAANEVASTGFDLDIKYEARTALNHARVMCVLSANLSGYSIEFGSLESGWISGRYNLQNGLVIELPVNHNGENHFSVNIYNAFGQAQPCPIKSITITRTLATIGAIPASHAISFEAADQLGGAETLDCIIHEGDILPKRGTRTYRCATTIKAGSFDYFSVKLWEGSIPSPIYDNQFIGEVKVLGTDLPNGVLPAGSEIECEYEMADSGTISVTVSIPCLGMTFNGKNFYSRMAGQIDLSDIDGVSEAGSDLLRRIDEMSSCVNDNRLADAREKALQAAELNSKDGVDEETVSKVESELRNAKKTMSKVRQDNLATIRKMELRECVESFNNLVRQYATSNEEQSFDNLSKTAQRAIDNYDNNFDNILNQMYFKSVQILMRQDWFIVDQYKRNASQSTGIIDRQLHQELRRKGDDALSRGDIDTVRKVLSAMIGNSVTTNDGRGMFENPNLIKG